MNMKRGGKRLLLKPHFWGGMLLSLGSILATVLVVFILHKGDADVKFAWKIIESIFSFGASLFGINFAGGKIRNLINKTMVKK
jgi:hypothetical protein